MKRLLLLSLVIMLAVLMVLGSSSKPGETKEPKLIRMTTPVPAGDDYVIWLQKGMDKFNARTKGAYNMKMFPGGQLAAFPESLDAIRTGAVEGGVIPPAAFAGTVPEFGLVELPFLFNNGEANAYAMTSIKDVWSELLQAKCNQRSLGCICIGTIDLISTKKPIKTLEDFKGLVVGCDAPPMVGLIKALGGSGIIVDFAEDYSNLQKGVIDAKTMAPQYMLIAKLYEVTKYFTIFHGLGSLYSINLNSDVYNKMPQDIKDILDEEMSALAQDISQKYVALFYDLVDDLEAKGVEYYYVPVTERNRWKELAYPGTLAALAKFGDVGAKIKQIADEANAKYPYTYGE